MAVLLVPQDGNPPIKFDRPILIIGRHPDCDIVLTSSRKVSRKHCCLALVNNRLLVRDLGSMNGVRVNGEDIQRESPVKVGDTIHIGDVGFIVQVTNEDSRPKRKDPTLPNTGKPQLYDPNSLPPGIDPAQLSLEVPVAIPEEQFTPLSKPLLPEFNDSDEDVSYVPLKPM
jgi:pSer/pThr/pTyr-binding forkhead associated (FHA) protein